MVDAKIRMPDAAFQLRLVAQQLLAVLLATTALGVVSARAVDGTWLGGNAGDPNEWTDPANWTSNPSLPDGTATFNNSGAATVANDNGPVVIGKVLFTAAPNAQPYTISVNNLFLLNGSGIVNNSTNTQTFNVSDSLVFQNGSSANGGTGPVTINNNGFIFFQNTSTTGIATIVNNSILQFNATSTAGSAHVADNAGMDFFDSTSAGNATIAVGPGGALTFNNTSTASNSAITTNSGSIISFGGTSTAANAQIDLVGASLSFSNSSTASNAIVTMSNVLFPGAVEFHDTSTAGSGNFNIIGSSGAGLGTLTFFDTSTAGNATIANNPGIGGGGATIFGILGGTDTSNAGTAHITNNNLGSTSFLANTSAANATITNNSGGNTNFQDQSTAGSATIVNNSGGTTTFGIPSIGTDTATAGTANIINHSGGTTQFYAATDAGNATITNDSGGFVQFGSSGGGDTASAGNSTITSSGTVSFNASSTAGSATLTTNSGGNVFFFDTSSGVSARFITNTGGTFDISALSSAGTTAGSIEGAGNYFLGSKNLAVGSNNLSTIVSGVISDGGTGGGVGGSLTKVGTGTLILTGTSTYTGGTTISAGTLQLGNGGTAGSIVGSVLDNGVFAINHSNAFAFNGVISGSGQFQQFGTGTTTLTALEFYSGLTTIAAGTLALTGAGNIASSSGVVANGAFDISGVSGAGTSIQTLSGSGSVAPGTKTLTLTNASGNFVGSIGGTGGVSLAAGTETLSGNNAYTGPTTITGGTLALAGAGSIASSSGVVDNATFDISGTNSGASIKTLSGTGIVALGAKTLTLTSASSNFAGAIGGTGGFTLAAGTETLSGTNTYTGATTISGGTLTIAAGGSITSNVTNSAAFTNSGSVTGSVTNSGTFNNNAGSTVSGLLINSFGITTNAGQLNGGASLTGGTLTNNNVISGAVGISGGFVNNNLTISGAVTNAGTFNNNSNGTVSGLLSNTAGATTNAGHLNGGATVTGGTLNTTGTISGGLTNSATVNAAGAVNGAIANNAGTFTVTGNLTSNSTFTNAAAATLAVGASTYTLQGLLTNSGAVTVANGGQLIDTVGGITNNAGGTIMVATGGTVKDDLNNAGSVTNNGAYSANVATNIGTITNNGVWTGNVVSNTGTITNNLTWTGTVSNAGTFTNTAGATVSGLLTNTAGIITNNGTLGGGATISGGALTGTGSVTNLTIASGGTFAPGNGTPGTSMTVTGNLAFQSGALYMVQVNPTTASFAAVAGSATLNGGAAAVYASGNYISKIYTILTAAGGVTGTFGSLVNTNLPTNVIASLSYDANDVFLDLKLKFVPPPSGTLNVNQQNVANTLTNFFSSTGSIPAAFAGLNAAGLTIASGELGTGVIQSSIKADDMFLNLLLDPSVAGRAGGFAPGGGAPQFAADDEGSAYAAKRKPSPSERDAYAMATKAPLLAAQPVNRWSVWGAAYGGSETIGGSAVVGSQDTTARVWGVVAGADYKVSPDTLLGFAVAGGGTSFTLANALGHGSSDLFQAGAFGRHNFGPAYISAALAYGWHDVTTNRTVALAGIDQLQGRFRAETFSARFEGGYRFATPMIGITPYAAAQVISFNLPAYAEQSLVGGGLFALNYAAQTTTATRTELGLRSDKSFAMQDAVLTLRGRAAWAHDYNPDRAVTAIFQALPGANFVVNGARGDPDGALVSAGAEMKWLNGFSLAATFEGEFSGNTTSYSGKGVARYTW